MEKLYGQSGHFRFYQLHLLKVIRRRIFKKRRKHKKIPHFVLYIPLSRVCHFTDYHLYNEKELIKAINNCNSVSTVQVPRFRNLDPIYLTLKRRLWITFSLSNYGMLQRAQIYP